jgi:transcriptional regulator with XRE-family HTH domain
MEALLARRDRQGLTFAQLSARSGVPVPTLSWWSSRLRRESPERTSDDGFVEVVASDAEPWSGARVEIVLRSGRQLVVREEIAAATLSRLMTVLESAC